MDGLKEFQRQPGSGADAIGENVNHFGSAISTLIRFCFWTG
jgi:hypothetical protein